MEKEAYVVIMGGGVAAFQLVRCLHSPFHVVIITKSKIRHSNSYKEQGGIAAVVTETVRLDLHVRDTLVGGRCDRGNSIQRGLWSNKLVTNSLLEGLVFGKRLAEFINHHPRVSPIRSDLYDYPLRVTEDEIENLDSEKLKWNMIENVGIIRNEAGLYRQLNWLPVQLLDSLMEQSLERLSIEQIQTTFMFINSFIMTKSAFIRKESRGSHIRSDFPNKGLLGKVNVLFMNKGIRL
ncbi:MAG: hypothetical protein IMW92_03260 [Bacillales bacterium]|nr:hypothetical protein [Bacillales bacterium]